MTRLCAISDYMNHSCLLPAAADNLFKSLLTAYSDSRDVYNGGVLKRDLRGSSDLL